MYHPSIPDTFKKTQILNGSSHDADGRQCDRVLPSKRKREPNAIPRAF
jgi:hypothetical protein